MKPVNNEKSLTKLNLIAWRNLLERVQIEIDYMICIKSIISNFLPCSRLKSIFSFGSSTQRNNYNHNKWYIKKTPYDDKSAWLILPAWLFLREKGETSLSIRGRMAFSLLIRNEKKKNIEETFVISLKLFAGLTSRHKSIHRIFEK